MPTLTRWYLKTALLYLILALGLGMVLAARGVWPLPSFLNTLTPVYLHLFVVGWLTQLIFGMAFWMFPKASATRPRGDERLAWATYALLNIGLGLRAVSEGFATLEPQTLWGWWLALGAGLQWAAGLLFIYSIWPRVKER